MSYTSQFPPAHNSTYVNANRIGESWEAPWFSTDPEKSVIGDWDGGMWYVSGTTAKFHIDLGEGKTIRRIYYENDHTSGNNTQYSVNAFTFWGTNDADAFANLTYADQTDWTQLTIDDSNFDEHVALNQADPKYILVTNAVSYRYYGFKISSSNGGINMGWRRIQLQTLDGSFSPSVSPSSSVSPSISPSASESPSVSVSPSLSPSFSPSISPSFSPSESPSLSPSFSPSISPSVSPSASVSPSVSVSPSYSPSAPPVVTSNGVPVVFYNGENAEIPVMVSKLSQVSTVTDNPVDAAPDGTLRVDTKTDDLYFRSNGTWFKVAK